MQVREIRNARGAVIYVAHSVLTMEDLDSATLEYAQLAGAELPTSLGSANFRGANLSGAQLYMAFAFGACFAGADLSCANLQGSNLIDADLSFANIEGADLTPSNIGTPTKLYGAKLAGARMDGAKLTSARFDGSTTFPAGFDPLAAGMVRDDAEGAVRRGI